MKWEPLMGAFIKINFDVTFDSVQSKSGLTIVARNAMGKVVVSRSMMHVEVGSTFTMEALACSWVVQTGLEMGLT